MIYNQILSERLEIGSHNLGGHLIQIKKDVARYDISVGNDRSPTRQRRVEISGGE